MQPAGHPLWAEVLGAVRWAGVFNRILCLPLFRQCKLFVCFRIPSLLQQMFYLCNWWSNQGERRGAGVQTPLWGRGVREITESVLGAAGCGAKLAQVAKSKMHMAQCI